MPDYDRPVPPHVAFARAVSAFRPGQPAIVLSHNDADGLSATAILARVFARTSRRPAQVSAGGRIAS